MVLIRRWVVTITMHADSAKWHFTTPKWHFTTPKWHSTDEFSRKFGRKAMFCFWRAEDGDDSAGVYGVGK